MDAPSHVFNILKANPPWLYGSEIVTLSKQAAQSARKPYPAPTRLWMWMNNQPYSIGTGSVYTVLDQLQDMDVIRDEQMNERNYEQLLQQRYGHGQLFTDAKAEVEEFWDSQRQGNPKREPLYRYVHWVHDENGLKRDRKKSLPLGLKLQSHG